MFSRPSSMRKLKASYEHGNLSGNGRGQRPFLAELIDVTDDTNTLLSFPSSC